NENLDASRQASAVVAHGDMRPFLKWNRRFGFDAQGIVEPALGQMNLDSTLDETHGVAVGLFRFRHPRDDRAVQLARIDPGGQGELVVEPEMAGIFIFDDSLAVEAHRLTDAARNAIV